MIDGTPRRRVPTSALHVLSERHEALCTAYRVDATPQVGMPSVMATARAVVTTRSVLDMYRSVRKAGE